jgi:hypothetical protein
MSNLLTRGQGRDGRAAEIGWSGAVRATASAADRSSPRRVRERAERASRRKQNARSGGQRGAVDAEDEDDRGSADAGTEADVRQEREEFDASGRFSRMNCQRYERELTYSASEYRELLLSYSGHRAMQPAAQQRLLSCIVSLIDDRYGGQIAKRYMNELAVASTS